MTIAEVVAISWLDGRTTHKCNQIIGNEMMSWRVGQVQAAGLQGNGARSYIRKERKNAENEEKV